MLKDFKRLQSELVKAGECHRMRFKDKVYTLISGVEEKYNRDVDECLHFLKKDNDTFPVVQGTYTTIRNILLSNSWVGWELCDFGPVLNIDPLDDFPVAMIAYTAIHLTDDGIDGHKLYKACKVKSFYDYSLEMGKGERESSALSAMMGMAVYNSCIQYLRKKQQQMVVETLLRLSCHIFSGMLNESIHTKPLSADSYKKIIKSKSIAYQMLLEHVFLKSLPSGKRTALLVLRSKLVEIGQLTDDLIDEKDDIRLNQFSIFLVPEMNREKLLMLILDAMGKLWDDCSHQENDIKNIMGLHLSNWIKLVIKEIENEGTL